jgi:arginyl-tRNA synthetase
VITDYAGELAVMFSKFYENVPVIKAKSHEEAKNRTAIVYAFMSAIKDIFDILGIEALEKM